MRRWPVRRRCAGARAGTARPPRGANRVTRHARRRGASTPASPRPARPSPRGGPSARGRRGGSRATPGCGGGGRVAGSPGPRRAPSAAPARAGTSRCRRPSRRHRARGPRRARARDPARGPRPDRPRTGPGQSDQVEHVAGRRGQPRHPGQDGVAHVARELPATGGEDLGDVERVASGRAVELVRVVSGSRPRAAASASSVRTPSGVSGFRSIRRTPDAPVTSPNRIRSAWLPTASSARNVTSTSARSRWMRRARCRSRSSVASSAQCTSSITRRYGVPGRASASVSRRKTSARSAPSGQTSPGRAGSISRSGPSGGGVVEPSQAPRATLAVEPASATTRSTNVVLPTPASPPMKTRRPFPLPAAAR